MPTYKPYTEVATLEANSQGDRTILEAHLDQNHAVIVDVLERLAMAVFEEGGVVVPGTVTNPSSAQVRVQGRMGVSKDAKTLLAVGDTTVDLASVSTGTKCLVVIRALAGATAQHNFTDATTGEALSHTLTSAWGALAVLEGDTSDYPALPDDCVPVAKVTKTGSSTLSLDEVVTTEPAPRFGGGGGAAWGGITGTLGDQTDLADAIAEKVDKVATINSYTGNRTLDTSDLGAYVRVTNAATVTLPDDLATGFQCVIVNATDDKEVALSAATTLIVPSGFEAKVQNRRAVTVIHVGSDVWEAHGALVEEEA